MLSVVWDIIVCNNGSVMCDNDSVVCHNNSVVCHNCRIQGVMRSCC